ncbi:hypothetical protein [Streptomyces malaysiensis]|uniref:hypothetical protein n=1 Tax=Streptomyces malaysiensis TaxID=92644 RepID=UPI0020C72021|nr:hypothetical protein [Streptomyces samsunensis]
MVGGADRVSAVTGGAVLRAGPRIFTGAGRRPRDEKDSGPETTGEEGPETSGRLRRIPVPPLAVPAALLAASPAVGVIPAGASAVGRAGALSTDAGGYRRTVLDGRAAAAPVYVPPHWPDDRDPVRAALHGPRHHPGHTGGTAAGPHRDGRATRALRRLQSGHIGDYVAWLVAGTALLTVLTVPGIR